MIPNADNNPKERMRSVNNKDPWPLNPIYGETAVVSAVWTSKFAVATPFAVHFYEYLFLAGKADHGWSEGYLPKQPNYR